MRFFIVFVFITIAKIAFSQTVGPEGWTILNPNSTEKIIYISSSMGNDEDGEVYDFPNLTIGDNPRQPANEIKAFATVEAAEAKVSNGDATWILFKTGDTWYERLNPKSGKSSGQPMIYSYYGEGPEQPLFKPGTQNGIRMCCRSFENIWVIGLSFYSHTRNPNDPDYVSSEGSAGISLFVGEGYVGRNLLFEGNVFRFFSNNTLQGWGDVRKISLRRNVILDNYSTEGHSQGLYSAETSELLLEENIFDHNGWYEQATKSEDKENGRATIFNHNTYFANVDSVRFVGNSFFRPSSIGTKWTANLGEGSSNHIKIINNLYYDCEVAISIGGNDNEPPYRFRNIEISENVLSGMGASHQTARTLGWTIDMEDWDSGICRKNYLVHQKKDDVTNVYGLRLAGQSRNVLIDSNIVYELKNSDGILVKNADEMSNITVSNNEVSMVNAYHNQFVEMDVFGDIDFKNNTYNNQGGTNDEFMFNGQRISYEDWLSKNLNMNSNTEVPAYKQPERSLEMYYTEILGLYDFDEFIVELRKQNIFNWRHEYTAPVINEWIKTGFEKTTITGIDNYDEIQDFSVSQKSGELTVALKRNGNLFFYSTDGKLIFSKAVMANETIKSGDLAPGLYILTLRSNKEESSTMKVVVD